ncbi:MAG: tetratricopeptide repeat protein, partial [Acidobacteria bacterium]|nr:tetratricopeptide repeat protein [Acidobacteriota bacterium]
MVRLRGPPVLPCRFAAGATREAPLLWPRHSRLLRGSSPSFVGRIHPWGVPWALGLLAAAGALLACQPRGGGDEAGTGSTFSLEAKDGSSLAVPLSAAAPVRLALKLPAASVVSLQLVLEPPGRVQAQVLDAGGGAVKVFDPAGNGLGSGQVRWVAERSGRYFVELGGPGSGTGDSVARLTFLGLRPAGAADFRAAAADRLAAEAEQLRGREEPSACRKAADLDCTALAVFTELADGRRRAEVLDHLGWIHRKCLEEMEPAAEHYRRAAELFGRSGDFERQAEVLNNLGRCHFALGQMDAAMEAWKAALALARASGSSLAEAAAYNHLALAARYLGEVQTAVSYYDRCLDVLATLGAPLELGRVYNNRGRLYRMLGDTGQAEADFERALDLAKRSGSSALEAIVLTALGQIQEERGDLLAARATLETALELRRKAESQRGLGATLRSLGSVEEKLGELGEARKALDEALRCFREVGSAREEASALEGLGRLAEANRGDAAPELEAALEGYRRVRDPHGEIRILTALASRQLAAGWPERAVPLLETALSRIEEVRGSAASPALSASYFAGQQEPFDLYVEVLMELHRHQPEAGFDARALSASERSRSRALLDLLAAVSAASPASEAGGLFGRKRRLEQRLAFLEEARFELSEGGREASGQLAAVESNLGEVLRRYRAVDGELRRSFLGGADAVPLGVEEIRRRVLDPDTQLLEVRLGERRSFLWLLSAESLSSFELPPRREVENAAEKAYRLLKASHRREARVSADRALEKLGEMLLGPAVGELRGKRLLVSVDGALLFLPFAALPLPTAEGSGRRETLLSRFEIVNLPSASALALARERHARRPRPPGTVAVLA